MAVLLLVLFLSRVAGFGHVSCFDSCQTTNCLGHVITKGLAPTRGDSKITVERGASTQLCMAQAASADVKHADTNEAGEDEAAKYKATTSASGSFDEAKLDYENAKKRVGEAYQTATETMTEGAKKEYENAKEKALKAAGDLGAKVREGTSEL